MNPDAIDVIHLLVDEASSLLFVDKNLTPIGVEKWRDLIEDRDYAVVMKTKVDRGVNEEIMVSTVWTGVMPLPFDTAVFGIGEGEHDRRSATIEVAMSNHRELVTSLLLGELDGS